VGSSPTRPIVVLPTYMRFFGLNFPNLSATFVYKRLMEKLTQTQSII